MELLGFTLVLFFIGLFVRQPSSRILYLDRRQGRAGIRRHVRQGLLGGHCYEFCRLGADRHRLGAVRIRIHRGWLLVS